MQELHRIDQVGDKIDVAVGVGFGEGEFTTGDHLPVGRPSIVGVGQRLRVDQDEAVFVGLVSQIARVELAFGGPRTAMKAHHQRQLFRDIEAFGEVLQVGSTLAIHLQDFGGELGDQH